MITTRSTSRRLTHPDLQPLIGTVLTAQERAARRQAEQARAELRLARWHRIEAANDAVDEYMRTSGTTNYPTAFAHIERTRPELFAEVQMPAHCMPAGNFNPSHDHLGRFTTSDGAVSPHLPSVVHEAQIDLSKGDVKDIVRHVSAGAFRQHILTGHCTPAVMREAIFSDLEAVSRGKEQRAQSSGDSRAAHVA